MRASLHAVHRQYSNRSMQGWPKGDRAVMRAFLHAVHRQYSNRSMQGLPKGDRASMRSSLQPLHHEHGKRAACPGTDAWAWGASWASLGRS